MSVQLGGIMAAGQGRRIGASSKALVPVGGIPLIDFILADMARAGVTRVHAVCRPDDEALHSHLAARAAAFEALVVLLPSGPGTLGAVRQLVSAAGGQQQVLSTCDVVAPKECLRGLIASHTGQAVEPLMTVLTSELIEDEAPIWVKTATDGTVIDMGKTVPPASRVFANMRIIGAGLSNALECLDLSANTQDSAFMGALSRANPGMVRWHDGGDVHDVDRPEDAVSAERLVPHTWAHRMFKGQA